MRTRDLPRLPGADRRVRCCVGEEAAWSRDARTAARLPHTVANLASRSMPEHPPPQHHTPPAHAARRPHLAGHGGKAHVAEGAAAQALEAAARGVRHREAAPRVGLDEEQLLGAEVLCVWWGEVRAGGGMGGVRCLWLEVGEGTIAIQSLPPLHSSPQILCPHPFPISPPPHTKPPAALRGWRRRTAPARRTGWQSWWPPPR